MLALKTTQLGKTYNNGVEALKGIDLHVEQGDFFALLGANGAGKSTTIGLITSLLNKTMGKIEVFGCDLDKQPEQAKSVIGLVPQEYNLNIFETCYHILIHQAGFYGIKSHEAKPRALELLEQLGLTEKKNTQVRQLSGGMKRRLMIARSLMHSPKLLILDEPTAGVDIEIRRTLWDFLTQLNDSGTTIILTTHYLEEAEQLCKNIAIIDQGNIVASSSMASLLKEFNHQTFILNTNKPISTLPKVDNIELTLIDDDTLEARISSDMHLNQLFAVLSGIDIQIISMRNKTNRLEELFLDLINHDE